MNKLLASLMVCFVLIFTIANVSATIYEPNTIYDGNTRQALTGVSVIGFSCDNADCSLNTKLWTETLNTGNSNQIVLQYPTQLKTEYGYKVYFYKPGYVPYKVTADWYGDGTTQNYKNYLYKITDSASAQIDNFQVSETQIKINEPVKITADILSPRLNTKNVQFVPAELKADYYSDDVKVTLKINGKVVETKNLDLFWSTDKTIEFTWTPSEEGDFDAQIFTEITDNKFTNTESKQTQKIKITVEGTQDPEDPTNDEDKKSKNIGHRTINLDGNAEDEKYLNQFNSKSYTDNESETSKTENGNLIWMIILAVILIAIVLVIVAILRR